MTPITAQSPPTADPDAIVAMPGRAPATAFHRATTRWARWPAAQRQSARQPQPDAATGPSARWQALRGEGADDGLRGRKAELARARAKVAALAPWKAAGRGRG
jgi:hypothetical protein